MTRTLARMRRKIMGGGVTLLALAAALLLAAQPAEAAPGAPTGVTAAGGAGHVALSWTAPSGTLTKYSYRYQTTADASATLSAQTWTSWTDIGDGSTTSHTVTGLAAGRYRFELRAHDATGAGTAAATSETTVTTLTDLYTIEFLNEADGVVQPGKNVSLKVMRIDGVPYASTTIVTKSISINGLTLRAGRVIYYDDDTHKRDGVGDPDNDPDMRTSFFDLGQVFDNTDIVFPALRAADNLPAVAAFSSWMHTIMSHRCYTVDSSGTRADVCSAANKKIGQPGTMAISLEIVVPPNTPPGEYVVTVKGYKSLTDSTIVTQTKTLTVGSAPSVTTVSFGPSAPRRALTGDTDTTPADGYADDASLAESTTIATGETTELTLSLQSALNKPPEAGTVSSIFITTTNGTLSTESIGGTTKRAQTANCKTQNASSCEIDLKPLKDSGGALPAKIRVQLKAPATPGTATVSATVIAGGKVHQPEPVMVTFTGPPKSLSLGEAPSTVLGYDVGKDQASDYDAAKAPDRGADARDQITFMVKATDGAAGAGNEVKTPTLTVAVHDGSGSLVSSGKYQTTQSGTLMNMLLLDVDASASAPLKPGEYKLTVTSVALKAEGMFTVAGDAAMMELALEPMSADTFGQEVTATATVTDAEGNAVADGTPVTFRVSDFRGDSDSVAVLDTTGAMLSKGGEAMATLTVVGAGNAVVRATTSKAGGGTLLKTAVLVSRAGAPADADTEGEAGLDCLSKLSGFSVWTCGSATASEIFGLVSVRGATAVHLWNRSVWVRYSMVDGTMVPGSRDFPVSRNDVIYISN